MSGHRLNGRAILRVPLGVVLFSFWSVCLASTIGCEIKSTNFVYVVMIHASLREHILSPSAVFPITSCVGARSKFNMAILQVLGQNLDSRLCHDFDVTEESILHIGAILIVETVWRIPWLGAQPRFQAIREEDGIWIYFDSIVCPLPLATGANPNPNLVEKCPIHPSASVLALHPVELAKFVIDLDDRVPSDVCIPITVHLPQIACEYACVLPFGSSQQI